MKIIDYKQAYGETVNVRLMIELNDNIMYKNFDASLERQNELIEESARDFCVAKYLQSIHGDFPFIFKNRKKWVGPLLTSCLQPKEIFLLILKRLKSIKKD